MKNPKPPASTFFELSTRVLTCDACGAPLEVPIEGGQVRCGYCEAVVRVTARPVIESFDPRAASDAADEVARLERLRAQDGALPVIPPPHIRKLCSGLLMPDENVATALTLFQAAREALKQGEAPDSERDLYSLAVLFSNYYGDKKDYLRLRAFLESALEATRMASTRQTLCAMLARTAARLGEQEAAEAWLEKCDPRSEELRSDTDYRTSRAFLAILRGDFSDVLATLGEKLGDVPISDQSEAACSLYRAHALEMLKGPDVAASELVRVAKTSFTVWFVLKTCKRQNLKDGLVLCPEGLDRAGDMLSWSTTSPYGVPLGCASVIAAAVGALALLVDLRDTEENVSVGGYSVLAAALFAGFVFLLLARKWFAIARDSE